MRCVAPDLSVNGAEMHNTVPELLAFASDILWRVVNRQ
jgi:hypothetical protein